MSDRERIKELENAVADLKYHVRGLAIVLAIVTLHLWASIGISSYYEWQRSLL